MAERSEETVVIERRGGSGIGVFLLGAAVGAGLALLFAPQTGVETRAEIGRAARKARDKAGELGENGREMAGDLLKTGREAAGEIAERGRIAMRDMKRTGRTASRDARSALEDRLAQHRDVGEVPEDGV